MENNKKQERLTPFDGGIAIFSMIALYLVISLVGQLIADVIFGVGSTGYIACCSTFSCLSMAIVIIFFSKKKSLSIKAVCKVNKFKPIYLLFALALSLGMFFGLGFINTAFIQLLDKVGISVSSTIIPLNNVWQLLLFIFLLAVLPAIIEEVFFRGLIFGSLKGTKLLWSILITSLCFALYHCSLAQLLYQFIYGVGLVILCKISNSTIPSIISHFINNFAVLVLEYLHITIDLSNILIIISGLIVLIAFFVFAILRLVKSENGNEQKSVKEFMFPGAIMMIVVCVVMIVCGLFAGA